MKSKKMRKELNFAIQNAVEEYRTMTVNIYGSYTKAQRKEVYKDIKAFVRAYNYYTKYDSHITVESVMGM